MKIKYKIGGNSNIFLNGGKNWEKFLLIVEDGFKHIAGGLENSKIGLPDANNYFLKPKNYILLVDFNKNLDIASLAQKVKQIESFRQNNNENFGEIILVGKNWLGLDVDQISKSAGNVHYIFFEKKVYKVFLKDKDFQGGIDGDFRIEPHSWIWVYNGSLAKISFS